MSTVYPIIFILDCSGSMCGTPIEVINDFMLEAHSYIENYEEDTIIKIGILSFSNTANWMTNGVVPVENFQFDKLEAGGLTNLGSAIKELSKSMRKEFFTTDDLISIAKPTIVFMSDGMPTDNWESELSNAIDTNRWYKGAAKLAVGFNDSDKNCLCKLVESEDAVIIVETAYQVGEMLEKILYYSVKDGCSSLISSPIEKSKRIMKNVLEDIDWK